MASPTAFTPLYFQLCSSFCGPSSTRATSLSRMMPELSSQAGASPDRVARDGVHSHADYPRAVTRPGGQQMLRMSGYNLAVVAAGIADLPDGGQQLVMAPTLLTPYPHPGR